MADSKKASELVTSMNLDLRPTQRYITAHDSNGKSVFSPSPELLYFNRGSYGVGWNYAVDRVPCVLQDNKDLQAFLTDDSASSSSYVHTGLKYTVAGGLTFATVDMAPGGQTTMHATVSLDFVCVIEGELVLELDSGEKQLLKSGVSLSVEPLFYTRVSFCESQRETTN